MRRQHTRSTAWRMWPGAPRARSPPSGPAATRGAPSHTESSPTSHSALELIIGLSTQNCILQAHLKQSCSTVAHHARHAHNSNCKHGRPSSPELLTSRRRSSHLLLCAGLAGLALATPALRIALCWVSDTEKLPETVRSCANRNALHMTARSGNAPAWVRHGNVFPWRWWVLLACQH